MREFLGDSTEELAKDSFLNIVAFPDGWRQRIYKDVLYVRAPLEFPKLINLLLSKSYLIKASISTKIGSLLLRKRLHVAILFLLHQDIVSSDFLVLQLLVSKLESLLITLHICHHIDIGSINILEGPLGLIYSDAHSLIDSSDLNSVTMAHMVH